jgi:hypothetical protein
MTSKIDPENRLDIKPLVIGPRLLDGAPLTGPQQFYVYVLFRDGKPSRPLLRR